MKTIRLPLLLTVAAGLAVWAVFYPAAMSVDSLNQYQQAVTRTFSNWHPPVISLLLAGVLALGGTLGLFMLGQCLAGVLAVWTFASACLAQPGGGPASRPRAAWLSFLVLMILLVPVSPLAFYLMTLWKDSWTMILLLWMGVLALKLVRTNGGPPVLLVGGLVGVAAIYGMVRHNAIVTLPVFGLFLWVEMRRRAVRRATALLLAFAPLLLCWLFDAFLHRAFHVREGHPGDTVLVLDLVGICTKSEEACQTFDYLKWFLLTGDYRARYRPGDMGAIYWEEPKIIDPAVFQEDRREILLDEYRQAAKRFPLLLAEVKIEAFLPLLQIEKTAYFFQDSLAPNDFGLAMNERFGPVRERLGRWGRAVARHPVLRWLSAVHLVWLMANVAWIAAFWIRSRRTGDRGVASLAVFLLVPLSYAFSYLLASPVPDFRFLYPSTLLVQCLTLSRGLGALEGRLSRWTVRARRRQGA